MNTKSKELITKAKELLDTIARRRELEKKESELKDFFKAKVEGAYLDAGGVLITFTKKNRTSLSRSDLEKEYGRETIAKFERTTEYVQIDCKEKEAV